jgi:hypothetical protein
MTNSLEWKPSRRTLRRFTVLIVVGAVVLGTEIVWLVAVHWR